MASLHLVNITISVPNGTVTHDDGHVLCVYGSSWRASLYIAAFFATNYAAHAATIKSNPGDKVPVTVCNIILALLFPVSGLMRAVNAIVRFGRWGGSDLEKACRSGALCMVVRTSGWSPAVGQTLDASFVQRTWTRTNFRRDHDEEGEQLDDMNSAASHQGSVDNLQVYRSNFAAEESSKWLYSDAMGRRANVSLAATKVHGSYSLPQGYGFAILPRDTRLLGCTQVPTDTSSGTWTTGNDIASTYSLAKAAVSIIQALAAFATLLGHREDVVQRWGYASFHLTVLPYLVMTVFNFISNICTADYDCLYMVETLVMDEARERGGVFEGTVAATYTVTGDPVLHGSDELESYGGLKDKIRDLSAPQIIEEILFGNAIIVLLPVLLPILLLSTLWMLRSSAAREQQRQRLLYLTRGPWMKTSTTIVEVRCSRAAFTAPEVLITAESHERPRESGMEQPDAVSNRAPEIGEGVEPDSLARRRMLDFLRSSNVPCAACDQEQARVLTKAIVYFPSCHRFLRGGDISPTDQQLGALPPTTDGGRSKCRTVRSRMPVRKRRHAFVGALAQFVVGVFVNGIILTLIGSQSKWFAAGQASLTQKVIMLLWMCEGTLGMFLVLLSFEEVLFAFILLPWYMLRATLNLQTAAVFAIPLATFVAPVWGFVIVAQMLVDWGQCVTLYH